MTPATETTATDYEVANARGLVLMTSPNIELARQWAKANATIHPDCAVYEVVRTVRKRRVYRPQIRLVA